MSNGPIESQIVNTLKTSMDLFSLKIINESFMHNVPEGSESHFKIVIVSEDFLNLTMIQRHKLVYKKLNNLMTKIHALSIHAFDKNEFKLNPIILDSPECANR
ncbi:BolA family transcriptional regulator [Gammaproteobacteria bacterium]|jgi:BolA protein|nr:BolA family transcriptional regulator [Gammaproteobacteria bacterium]